MKATLVNLDKPGTPGGLSRSRLLVEGKLYVVKNGGDGLLAIRRNHLWEWYRATETQFEYRCVGSTLHLVK